MSEKVSSPIFLKAPSEKYKKSEKSKNIKKIFANKLINEKELKKKEIEDNFNFDYFNDLLNENIKLSPMVNPIPCFTVKSESSSKEVSTRVTFYSKNSKNININKEKKRTQWKDEDLMEKIELVNNWKNTNWFQPNKTFNPDMKKREILKPLVLSKEKIMKEQDKLKEEKINENKRKIKHDLMELRHQQIKEKNIEPIKYSKYPINKRENTIKEQNQEKNELLKQIRELESKN